MKKICADTYEYKNCRISYEPVGELKERTGSLIDPNGCKWNRLGFWTIYTLKNDIIQEHIANVWKKTEAKKIINNLNKLNN